METKLNTSLIVSKKTQKKSTQLRLSARRRGKINVCAIAMIRNEADIIELFLRQATTLFDRVMVVDVQSTDGTFETIESCAAVSPEIEIYTCSMQERYQAAMMEMLARKAVDEGADWIFFLDADEFISIPDAKAFHDYLANFADDVMHMPWINLVPQVYGDFSSFDIHQSYRWTGRVSPFRKVAISSAFAATHPDFRIFEGNHNVSVDAHSHPVEESLGLNLLHLPVRSASRLRYKLQNSIKLLRSKHNTYQNEGSHASKIISRLAKGRVSPIDLNIVAANYGVNNEDADEPTADPAEMGWPVFKLPNYAFIEPRFLVISRNIGETIARDKTLTWDNPAFVKGSPIAALLNENHIGIVSQPFAGDGTRIQRRYAAFPVENEDLPTALSARLFWEAIENSFVRIEVSRFSAWSKLIPLLFAIFSVTRPRRYVELGVHNGMSFFAACQIAEKMGLKTQCVAIDSWVGDPHASFHADEIFDVFRSTVKERYPRQHYIQGMFRDALPMFEDGSVDLLHIDGYHTYEAVRDDFETWLAKMSDQGVILFHDISVHERNFGVWKFWKEVSKEYPSFGFTHCHGLGVLCVGPRESAMRMIIEAMSSNADVGSLAQQYFESMGELAVEHRAALEGSHGAKELLAAREAKIQELLGYLEHRDQQIAALMSDVPGLTNELSGLHKTVQELQSLVQHRDQQIAALTSDVASFADERSNLQDMVAARDKWMLELWPKLFAKTLSRSSINAAAAAIRASKVFDADYYLKCYTDVAAARVEPIKHFARFGACELRNPSASFNTAEYLLDHPEIMTSLENPLVHFIKNAKPER